VARCRDRHAGQGLLMQQFARRTATAGLGGVVAGLPILVAGSRRLVTIAAVPMMVSTPLGRLPLRAQRVSGTSPGAPPYYR
ncbi:MAG: hypothetical protein LH471_09570, partial [Salinibacterium sp.]|nr:hypothetical protein [Salinibacterium sp.]